MELISEANIFRIFVLSQEDLGTSWKQQKLCLVESEKKMFSLLKFARSKTKRDAMVSGEKHKKDKHLK